VRDRSGWTWTVEATPEQALDVFYHPFAYCTNGLSVDDVPMAA